MKKLLIISASVLINTAIFSAESEKRLVLPLDHNSPELKATFNAVQGINTLAKIVEKEVCTRWGAFLLSSKDCLLNAHYDQTEQGLYLNIYNGIPNSLETPWGKVTFYGERSLSESETKEVQKKFLEKMILKPVEKDRSFFSIVSFNDIKLPDAEELDEEHYREYKEVEESWKTMMEQYKREKKKALN